MKRLIMLMFTLGAIMALTCQVIWAGTSNPNRLDASRSLDADRGDEARPLKEEKFAGRQPVVSGTGTEIKIAYPNSDPVRITEGSIDNPCGRLQVSSPEAPPSPESKIPFDGPPNVPDKSVTKQGGDTIEDAYDVGPFFFGSSFLDSGTTTGYNDDYFEACPYTSTGAPDVVYMLSPISPVTVTLSLCASSYDTKLIIYENAHTPGSPYACNDDHQGCGDGYCSYIEALELDTGIVYYIVVDGYSDSHGDYVLSIYDTGNHECGYTTIFGQSPVAETDIPRAAYTSDSTYSESPIVYDNFDDAGVIKNISFWGISGYYDGAWEECDNGNPMMFEIKFYADDNGSPGAEVFSTQSPADALPTGQRISLSSSEFEVIQFVHPFSLGPVDLVKGWVSIQCIDPNDSCWFIWLCDPEAEGLDDHSYRWDGSSLVDTYYDFAFCLQGRSGENVRTANRISGPTANIYGATDGFSDNYDEQCPDPSTSPDYVASYTPESDIAVTVSLANDASLYDTKLFVYENAVTPGAPYACSDDDCGVLSVLKDLELTANNTYYMVIDGWGGEYGSFGFNMYESPWTECPDGSNQFSQPVHRESDLKSAATSDLEVPDEAWTVYDNFNGVDIVDKIHFWGITGYHDGDSWVECEKEEPIDFNIAFFTDDEGMPDVVTQYYFQSLTPTGTGLIYYSAGAGLHVPLYEFTATLDPPCTLSTGWLAIKASGDPDCWFLWMNAKEGTGLDGHCLQLGTVSGFLDRDYDQAFCLFEGGSNCCMDWDLPGDANDDMLINLLDILDIIAYVYQDPIGDPPNPHGCDALLDCNGDGTDVDNPIINLLDILAMIEHVYQEPVGEPAMCCPPGCQVP